MSAIGNNVDVEVKGNKLTITIDVSDAIQKKAQPSSSGKTYVIASTGGHALLPNANGLKLNLTVTKPNGQS